MNKILDSTKLYALLIFIGFFNLYTYYNQFEINITSYLNTGELLLSFLKLSIPIVTLLILLVIILIYIIYSLMTKQDSEEMDKSYDFNLISLFLLGKAIEEMKEWNKDHKFFTWESVQNNLGNLINILFGLASILFFVGYISYILVCFEGIFENPSLPFLYIGIVPWLLMFYELMSKIKGSKDFKYISSSILMITLIIAFIQISGKERAKKTIANAGLEKISFVIHNDTIQTDSNLIYIGRTADYIFLKELDNKKNWIYSTKNITCMTLEQLD